MIPKSTLYDLLEVEPCVMINPALGLCGHYDYFDLGVAFTLILFEECVKADIILIPYSSFEIHYDVLGNEYLRITNFNPQRLTYRWN